MTFNLPTFRNKDSICVNKDHYKDGLFSYLFNDMLPLRSSIAQQLDVDLSPRIDISETDTEYRLDAELPGVEQKDVDVRLDNNILTIKGKKESASEEKDRNYYLQERYYGSFQRSISLPSNIADDQISAKFTNGVLHIAIAKKNKDSTKRIEVM